MTKQEAISFLVNHPAKFGHLVGFTKLVDLHNKWIKEMLLSREDKTLQGHRESYKTTCLSIALALVIILFPLQHTLFMRKTDDDVKEVLRQVKKILQDEHTRYFVKVIWGVDLVLTTDTVKEITTNLCISASGTGQLIGAGVGSSLTGKHYENIFTDDIVNIKDRISRATREETKLVYQELQNVKNKETGRIFNTGTPWHKDDCFMIMPEAEKYDCYTTGMLSEEQIEDLKSKMIRSLFCANYELRHIASEDVMFDNPNIGAEPHLVEQAKYCHIDASYGGEDWTAMTIARKSNGNLFVFGKIWHKHVDDCIGELISWKHKFMAGKFLTEKNADKGYLAKELRQRGERAVTYNESMNKFLKISSYLKFAWNDIYFVQGTDDEYLQMILDYNENAEHDDAPDSLASVVRKLYNKEDI